MPAWGGAQPGPVASASLPGLSCGCEGRSMVQYWFAFQPNWNSARGGVGFRPFQNLNGL